MSEHISSLEHAKYQAQIDIANNRRHPMSKQANEVEHTPTPWYYNELFNRGQVNRVAIHPPHFYFEGDNFIDRALNDAKHIVRCVNSYGKLTVELKAHIDTINGLSGVVKDLEQQNDKLHNSHDTLVDALKQSIADLEVELGEWVSVQDLYCPITLIAYKHILSNLEQALKDTEE